MRNPKTAVGIAVGIAIGTGIGASTDNIGMGVGIGLALGLDAPGALRGVERDRDPFDRCRHGNHPRGPPPRLSPPPPRASAWR